MKKKRFVERVNSIFSITNVANLFVTILKVKDMDVRRCIAKDVRKDGKVRMTREGKKWARAVLEQEGFNRYGIIDDEPDVLSWGKEFEVLFETMDGYPARCRATYVVEPACKNWFKRVSDGARMSNVFAFKEITE